MSSSAETPAVTVLLPTFNRLAYLRAALTGLESQTYRSFELIVLDDGSSDGTKEFLQRFNPRFPVRVEMFSGRERSYLRNVGVNISRGALIAFHDDDDIWLPEKLERQVRFMDDHPETGLSYCFTSAINSLGEPDVETTRQHERLYRRHASAAHTFEKIAESCLIFTSSVMVRREVFAATGGFGEDYIGSEDWDFYLKVAKVSRIAALPETLVQYRMHPGNSTAGDEERRIKVSDGRMRAAIQQLETAEGARARALLLRAIAQNHYWANRNRESLRFSLASIRTSPRVFASPANVMMLAKSLVKSIR